MKSERNRLASIIKRAVMKECEPDAVQAIEAMKRACRTVANGVIKEAGRRLCVYCKQGRPSHDIRPFGIEGQAVPFLHEDVNGLPVPCFIGKLRTLAAQAAGGGKRR